MRVRSAENPAVGNTPEETLEQLTKQVAKGGVIAFGGNIIGRIAGFGLHVLLGRVLGPGAYGLYALGISVLGVAQSIASLGLNQGVVRFCAMYRGEGDSARVKGTILSALAISLISSGGVAGVLFLFSDLIAQRLFHEPELTWLLRVFAFSLPFYVLTGVLTSFAQSFRRIDYQQSVQSIFKPLFNLALVGFAFLLGFRLAGAVGGFLLTGIVSAGLAGYFLWKIFPEIKSNISPAFDQTGKLIKFSLPMIFVTMYYFLAMRTDRIMLGWLSTAKNVGIYSAAANVALQIMLIHTALVSIFMPIIANVYHRQQLEQVKNLYNVVKRWSSYGTFFLALFVIFYPKFVMSIFGSQFVEGWPLLMVLSGVYVIGSIVGPTGALLQMSGRQNVEFLNGILMMLANIMLNYFLIPIYGYLGAALATLLSGFLMNMIQIGQIYRFFRFHPFDRLHVQFTVILFMTFVVAVVVNLYMTPIFKFFFLLLGVVSLLGIAYHSRNVGDEAVWKSIKAKLAIGRG